MGYSAADQNLPVGDMSLQGLYELHEEIGLAIALAESEEREALALIARVEAEMNQNPDAYRVPDQVHARMFRRLRQSMRQKRAEHFARHTLPRSLKAACVSLFCLYLGLTTALAAVPSLREGLAHMLIQRTPAYSRIGLNTDGRAGVPEDWPGTHYPSFLPAGYAPFRIREDGESTAVYFENGMGNSIAFMEQMGELSTNINTENAHVETIYLKDFPVTLSTGPDVIMATWFSHNQYFLLWGNEKKEILLKMVEGVERIR